MEIIAPPERSGIYVELRAHTGFSFGDGSVTPETLVERAVALGYATIGITDTADLGGLVRAVLAGRAHDVRILVGAELRVDGLPAAFLARDAEGYRNLAALVTHRASASGRLGQGACRRSARPAERDAGRRCSRARAGLHALTGPATGRARVARARRRRVTRAGAVARRWREVFGERLAIEVQLHSHRRPRRRRSPAR